MAGGITFEQMVDSKVRASVEKNKGSFDFARYYRASLRMTPLQGDTPQLPMTLWQES
jgi:hypothetical protein